MGKVKNRKQNKKLVKMLVRTREDFQQIRKAVDSRLGRKANGEDQNIDGERGVLPEDFTMLEEIATEARRQEKECEKKLDKILKRFPIYTEFLNKTDSEGGVSGCGTIAAGWLIGEIDIHIATNVSKIWSFMGLSLAKKRGRKSVKKSKYKKSMGKVVKEFKDKYIILSHTLIRSDKLTPGFLSPFNKPLKAAIVEVMASGFIKAQNEYCIDHYYPYKNRLAQSDKQINGKNKKWSETSDGHRDRAAKRKMVKEFLKDLYAKWRELEGLNVRKPYKEEYLGKKHKE